MKYPDYLVHYNKNHNPKTGQFAPGDGDGDGVSNDHANRSKNGLTKGEKIAIGVGAGAVTAGTVASAAIILGSMVSAGKDFVNSNSNSGVDYLEPDYLEPDYIDADYAPSLQKQLSYNANMIKDRYSF